MSGGGFHVLSFFSLTVWLIPHFPFSSFIPLARQEYLVFSARVQARWSPGQVEVKNSPSLFPQSFCFISSPFFCKVPPRSWIVPLFFLKSIKVVEPLFLKSAPRALSFGHFYLQLGAKQRSSFLSPSPGNQQGYDFFWKTEFPFSPDRLVTR